MAPSRLYLMLVLLSLQSAAWKVADFGLTTRGSPSRGHVTVGCAGTKGYKSPECVKYRFVNVNSDMWALGVILFELICGKHPFESESDFLSYSPSSNIFNPLVIPRVVDARSKTYLLQLTRGLLQEEWWNRPSARDFRGILSTMSRETTEILDLATKKLTRATLDSSVWERVTLRRCWYVSILDFLNSDSRECCCLITVRQVANNLNGNSEARRRTPPVYECGCLATQPLMDWTFVIVERSWAVPKTLFGKVFGKK